MRRDDVGHENIGAKEDGAECECEQGRSRRNETILATKRLEPRGTDHIIHQLTNPIKRVKSDERNMLSVGYKSLLASKRAAWRVVYGLEQGEDNKRDTNSEFKLRHLRTFREKLEKEIDDTCREILTMLEDNLIPHCQCAESAVFYFKMKGDYYRYLAEFKIAGGRREASEKALVAYRAASQTAEAKLTPASPVVLGLALNFSVFYYEILHSPEKACQIAQTAFDKAKADLSTLPKDVSKDSTLILQLLRDNLSLWTADLEGIGHNTPLTSMR